MTVYYRNLTGSTVDRASGEYEFLIVGKDNDY